jgi:hypothetical protein
MKLGFLVGPDFSLKHVLLGKLLYLKLKTSKLSEIVPLVRVRTEVLLVQISSSEVKTVTRGSPYKFALLKGKKSTHLGKVIIKLYWRIQSWSNMGLERRHIRLPQVEILDSEGPKL